LINPKKRKKNKQKPNSSGKQTGGWYKLSQTIKANNTIHLQAKSHNKKTNNYY
jgi:hypothetical protein